MKAINITPTVYKLMVDLKDKGVDASRYTLEKALEPELVQVFREVDSKYFWFEDHGAPKYSIHHLKTRIARHLDLVYRDDWKEDKKTTPKSVAESVKIGEEELHKVSPEDLRAFVNSYMKNYKMSEAFKKETLTDKEMANFFAEVSKSFTAGINEIVTMIYGGKKPEFSSKNKMTAEARKEFSKHNREEFDWFLDNIIWLGKPSETYLKNHRKFNTANYLKVTADLRSLVSNSLYQYRTLKMF